MAKTDLRHNGLRTDKMKLAIVAVTLALAALTMAEDCPNHDPVQECTHIACSGTYHTACIHRTCSCTPTATHSCTSQSDCAAEPCTSPSTLHCLDNRCHCVGGHHGNHQHGQ